ncbi:MAG: hypothetical protein HND44_14940 [Chloroflexi bacterium]|nr:hypothetical protein [Ardenticatenaceae bacterium]NOG35842.1 hypothetical protein [Chloroflexota bacterium]
MPWLGANRGTPRIDGDNPMVAGTSFVGHTAVLHLKMMTFIAFIKN